ncbi:MAG TPA: diacylglycerol kinase family protein [Anaerolineales bacterium]|nr:diacylglycerol kinase family protein [Anaerolineales bacterium]
MQIDLEQKPKTYIVINPVAGVSQLETVREKIQSALQERDIPFEIYETTGKDDLRQNIHAAIQDGFGLFIAAGGDGTISDVVDGMVGSQIPLVIIPTGTWNALARVMDIPLQIDNAIKLLFQEHEVRTIDAIEINNNYFVLSVSAGIGARTMKGVEREEKRRFGKFADLWSAIREVLQFRSYPFEVKIDGKLSKFRASELMVANSGNLGLKSLQLDPGIRMDDGKLNVCRIYANTVSDYLRLAVSILRGAQKHTWNISCVEALHEVEIRSRENLPVQGDGDVIGRLPIKVTIHPKAVHIVAPINSVVQN